jgi:hypothetical protein
MMIAVLDDQNESVWKRRRVKWTHIIILQIDMSHRGLNGVPQCGIPRILPTTMT